MLNSASAFVRYLISNYKIILLYMTEHVLMDI